MTTRAEWLAARERVRTQAHAMFSERESDRLTEAALGPCPPEPEPEPWCSIGATEVRLGAGAKDVWVGIPGMAHELLTAEEADAMAGALIEHAAYAREHR